MDKLELKHIAPYLPYKLQWCFEGEDFSHEVIGFELNTVHLLSLYNDYGRCTIDEGKPILRPLSDLNNAKLFDNYGDEKLTAVEEFSGNWDLGALDWVLLEVSKGNQIERLLELSYNVIEKLIEYHFDIFGLIDAGLAIDINTLKNEK